MENFLFFFQDVEPPNSFKEREPVLRQWLQYSWMTTLHNYTSKFGHSSFVDSYLVRWTPNIEKLYLIFCIKGSLICNIIVYTHEYPHLYSLWASAYVACHVSYLFYSLTRCMYKVCLNKMMVSGIFCRVCHKNILQKNSMCRIYFSFVYLFGFLYSLSKGTLDALLIC